MHDSGFDSKASRTAPKCLEHEQTWTSVATLMISKLCKCRREMSCVCWRVERGNESQILVEVTAALEKELDGGVMDKQPEVRFENACHFWCSHTVHRKISSCLSCSDDLS